MPAFARYRSSLTVRTSTPFYHQAGADASVRPPRHKKVPTETPLKLESPLPVAAALTTLNALPAIHDEHTARWHREEAAVAQAMHPQALVSNPGTACPSFLTTVVSQHRANYELWHTEDHARAPQATDAEIAEVKRAIDRINQQRNDLAELCDTLLLEALASANLLNPEADLHSESPGLMIDRLSILALKLYHTREELTRGTAAPADHQERNRKRLAILTEQRDDLASSLTRLWRNVLAGHSRFKLYRQLKMYNDPTLNPQIYTRHAPGNLT